MKCPEIVALSSGRRSLKVFLTYDPYKFGTPGSSCACVSPASGARVPGGGRALRRRGNYEQSTGAPGRRNDSRIGRTAPKYHGMVLAQAPWIEGREAVFVAISLPSSGSADPNLPWFPAPRWRRSRPGAGARALKGSGGRKRCRNISFCTRRDNMDSGPPSRVRSSVAVLPPRDATTARRFMAGS